MKIGDLFFTFRGDDSQLQVDAQKAGERAVGAFGKGAKSRKINLGSALAGTGAALGAAFVGAVESAAQFEDQLRTINTVAGLSDAELRKMGDGIQALARETGKPTEDLTAGLYDIVSAGIDARDALDVLRASATLSIGALGSTAEAVNLVTGVLNAYKLPASDASRVTDIFAKAVADGKVTAAELGSTIATVAPIAAQAGISVEELSAGYAALTAVNVPAAGAATQMSAAIRALISPTAALNRLQAATGKNFAEIARQKGLAAALDEIRQATTDAGTAFDKLSTELPKAKTMSEVERITEKYRKALGLTKFEAEQFTKNVGKQGAGEALALLRREVVAGDQGFKIALGTVEAYQFALATTGTNAAAFAAQIEETQGAVGIAAEQAAEKMKSPVEQAKRWGNIVFTALQDIGKTAEPIAPLLLTLNQLGPALGGLLTPARLVGSLIGGLGGLLLSGLGSIVPAIAGGLAALGSTIGGVIAAAIPVGMALLPVILIGALVAAIALLIVNPELRDQVFAVGGQIIDTLAQALGGLIDSLGGIVSGVVGALLSIPGRIAGLVGDLLGIGSEAAGGFLDALVRAAGDVIGTILGIPGKIIGGLVDGFSDAAGKAAQAFIGGIAGLPGKVGDVLGGVGDFIGGLVPKFQGGAIYTPEGLAYLHEGEMVIPAADAEAIRSGRATLGVGAGSPAGVQIGAINVYNPAPEPASTSVRRELQLVALGLA